MFDGEAFGQQMVDIVKGYVDRATAPLLARIAELESRSVPPAAEVDMDAVTALVEDAAVRAVAALPPVLPVEVDMDAVAVLVEDAAVRAAAALPPVPAAEVDMEAVALLIEVAAVRAAAALPPVPAAEVDMDAVAVLVEDAAARAVSALPKAKDGVGLASALIDKSGQLVVTMSDGSVKELGIVVGDNGKNGATFTLDDFDIEPYEDGRTFKFCFTNGEEMHSFELCIPSIIDRGVYSTERDYERGDAVSWGGSLWIAQKDGPGKPDTADSGWRLAVKKGRDGKDAK